MKKRIQVMVEPELYNQIEVKAKELGLSLSSYIRFRLLDRPLMIDGNKLITVTERVNNGRNKLD